jgi:murein L,D-transpeptidase YafK
MKIIFFILLGISLFGDDILTNYRINGIKEIEKKMDMKLAQKEYWSEYLQDKDTTFGYLETYSSILTCNKTDSTLNLYKRDENSTFKLQKEYAAYTGKKPGDKVKEGDLRTPIGIYEITKRLNNVDPFYGPMAFVTSYPNLYDKYRGKNGHGIWIHGVPTEQNRDEFTKGCIAINNVAIESLDEKIKIDDTLLIIDEAEISKNISKERLVTILSQLYMWRYSWLYNDIDTYLNFYADDFSRADKMGLNQFKRYKTRIFRKNESKTIIFNDINIVRYPNTQNIFQITFNEIYRSKSFSFTGKKTLIVRMDTLNNIKIFIEK